jgi:hypothetical protein
MGGLMVRNALMAAAAAFVLAAAVGCATQSSETIESVARADCIDRGHAEGSNQYAQCMRDTTEALRAARHYDPDALKRRPPKGAPKR